MTIDRAKIMNTAWAVHRSLGADRLARMGTLGRRIRFANCLRNAWNNAKAAARAAAPVAHVRTAAFIADAILTLECKDRLSFADYAELRDLSAELTAAQRREAVALAA